MTLESLIIEYKNAVTHKEKARIEQLIWNFAPLGICKRNWICKTLGIGPSDIEARRLFYRLSAWAEPLWPMLENGLGVSVASRVVKTAYGLSKSSGLTPDDAIKQALAAECAPKKVSKESPFKNTENNQASKEFHSAVEKLTLEFATRTTKGLEEHISKQLIDEFIYAAECAYEDFSNAVVLARRRASKIETPTKIGRAKFKQACEVLSLSYNYGSKIPKRELQKAKNQRAFELHPDRHQDVNPMYSEELIRVNEAYKTLDTYNRQG